MTHTEWVGQRAWPAKQDREGLAALHALGNGRMYVYGQGPNIVQMAGPPYSAPDVSGLRFDADGNLTSTTRRLRGAAVYQHALERGGAAMGTMTDCIDAEIPCMARRLELKEPVVFTLHLRESADNLRDFEGTEGVSVALLTCLTRGTEWWNGGGGGYTTHGHVATQFFARGQIRISAVDEKAGDYEMRCEPGVVEMYWVGGPDYRSCVLNTREVLTRGFDAMLDRTRVSWEAWSVAHTSITDGFKEDMPLRDELVDAVDDVAVLIRAQQGIEGAVMAGHLYPLGFVRDQYGVARGFLATRHVGNAEQIMRFYWDVFQREGRLHNAQGIGVPDAFHIHENDGVEMTGYLIIQTLELAEAMEDDAVALEMMPMLEWAMELQRRNLAHYTLPFNGDETYIAGGAVPRTVLMDGSAESTLLFIESGQRLHAFLQKHGLWTSDDRDLLAAQVGATAGHYTERFMRDGRLCVNDPERVESVEQPEFRYGVCGALSDSDCRVMDWLRRTEDARYLCARCYPERKTVLSESQRYFLPSVALTSHFIGSDLLPSEDNEVLVETILENLRETGRVSSSASGRLPGYELGFLLHALCRMQRDESEAVYRRMMQLRDASGAWVEYYDAENLPNGCRCRAWESGINLDAALRFAREYSA